MTLKHRIAFFFFTLSIIYVPSQINYLAVDHSSFALKQRPPAGTFSSVPQENTLRFNGTYIGESFQLRFAEINSLGIGLGLTKIEYEKQWLGIFSEKNVFGVATLKGKIQYLSLPFSVIFINSPGIRRSYLAHRNIRSGISITYVPSFQAGKSFALNTYAAADSSSFFSGYDPAPREFQHTLSLGLCSQLFFFNKYVRLDVEPYFGYGSRYFNEKGNSGTFTYGIKLQLSIHLPRISIERQGSRGSAEEKRKHLEQKQKEIQDQLNKQP